MSNLSVTVLTSVPHFFPGILGESISGKALKAGVWDLRVINLHDFGLGKWKKIDDTPFGGGAGMIMRVDVLCKALDYVLQDLNDAHIVYLSPRGKILKQKKIHELTKKKNLVIICNRFEGLDNRIFAFYDIEEISIGDYILSGGEIASYVLLDACIRTIPNVMGGCESSIEESFCNEYENLLEYSHYTKPRLFRGESVPEVLVNGNHKLISEWKLENAKKITKYRRTDLWNNYLDKKGENND